MLTRTSAYGLDLGREPKHTNKISGINGRVCLGIKSFHNDLDLAGLIERARFGSLPLSLAARYRIGRVIDSRICYAIIQRGFVIPASGSKDNNREQIRTLEEINAKDKGGMIFSPRVGLHENVVARLFCLH
jgi:DNA polymerase elongation subunit (family B)